MSQSTSGPAGGEPEDEHGNGSEDEPSGSSPASPFESEGRPDAHGRRIGVLLSHGFTGSPFSMKPWAYHLADLGYAVSVPRLPGHGTSWQDLNRTGFDDWYAEVERAFERLRARTDTVVVAGLSMGGALALKLAAQRTTEVSGVVLVNAAVSSQNKQLLAVPFLKWVVPSIPGIGGDIKRPGTPEHSYRRTPLRPVHSMTKGWARVRTDLPQVTQPVLLFRSRIDHVVDEGSARDILSGVSSRDVTERVLEDSYHVATLDNDAEQIFSESADFVARVTAAEQPVGGA